MAEYIPGPSGSEHEPKTLFTVKLDNHQFIVTDNDDSRCTVHEDTREHYNTCLNNFERALAQVNENGYDKNIISQLLLSNTHLIQCIPKRKIQELEMNIAPLRHELATYKFIVGSGDAEANAPSQEAAAGDPGSVWSFKPLPHSFVLVYNTHLYFTCLIPFAIIIHYRVTKVPLIHL